MCVSLAHCLDESHGWFWGRQLEEAISEFLEAAKTAEQIDGDKTVGPGAGGTNIVGFHGSYKTSLSHYALVIPRIWSERHDSHYRTYDTLITPSSHTHTPPM